MKEKGIIAWLFPARNHHLGSNFGIYKNYFKPFRLLQYQSVFWKWSLLESWAMAPHSSTLAWKIPWMEEPGRLQTMGSLRVGHDWATSVSLFTFMHWRRKWQPTPVFLPGESQGRGTWWAAVYGVSQSRTWLQWPSSSRELGVCSTPRLPLEHHMFHLLFWSLW